MRGEGQKMNWESLIFIVLIGIDLLIGWRIVQRFVLHQGAVSPDAPFFLLLLMVLQLALIVMFGQWKRTLKDHLRLRESYEHELDLSRQIMENDDSCVIVMASNGVYTFANRATCGFLGLQQQDIVGRSAEDFIVEPGGEALAELLTRPLTQTLQVPVTLRHASGSQVQLMVRVVPRW